MYEIYKTPIYNFLYQMTGDVEDAKDLTQESFLAIYKVIMEERKVENLRAYLYTIARNLALTRNKKRSRECPDEDHILRTPDPGYYSDPEKASRNRKQQEDIVRTLQLLPDNYREVLILREQAGFSYDRIAAMLDTSKTNVGVLLYRARSRFREMYRMMQVTGQPSSPDCERILPLISAWLDGETSRKEEAELQNHMAECPFCRMASEQMVDASRSYNAIIPLLPPMSVKAGLMAKAGLSGTVSTSIATGAATASGAAGFTAGSTTGAATASASSAMTGGVAGAGTAAAAGGIATGITAKVVSTAVAAVIALAAIGGGTFMAVRQFMKPPAAVSEFKAEIAEFLQDPRSILEIAPSLREELALRGEEMEELVREFVEEYFPAMDDYDLAAHTRNGSPIVHLSGILEAFNTEDGGNSAAFLKYVPIECEIELGKKADGFEIEQIKKIMPEIELPGHDGN